MRPVEGHVRSSDGVRLHFKMLGEGSDTTVVIHGGPGDVHAPLLVIHRAGDPMAVAASPESVDAFPDARLVAV